MGADVLKTFFMRSCPACDLVLGNMPHSETASRPTRQKYAREETLACAITVGTLRHTPADARLRSVVGKGERLPLLVGSA